MNVTKLTDTTIKVYLDEGKISWKDLLALEDFALVFCRECNKTYLHRRFAESTNTIHGRVYSQYYCMNCGLIWQSPKHPKFPKTIFQLREQEKIRKMKKRRRHA